MSVNRCKYLISEYIGKYHAALCRCEYPQKLCPRKHRTSKGKVNATCFNLVGLNNPDLTAELTAAGTYGTGEPTVATTKPLEMTAQ